MTNGDFETGSAVLMGGEQDEANGAGGAFHVVSDANAGAGMASIMQTFTLPAGASNVLLTFDYYKNNLTSEAIHPAGLDFNVTPNQHSRIDLLTAAATAFTTAPRDVVANLFLSGPNQIPYSTGNTIDITAFVTPGTTYQIRFAFVGSDNYYHFGVDNVSIFASGPVAAVPTLSQWGLIILGLLILNLGVVFVMRKAKLKESY